MILYLCLFTPVIIALGVWIAVAWASGTAEKHFDEYEE